MDHNAVGNAAEANVGFDWYEFCKKNSMEVYTLDEFLGDLIYTKSTPTFENEQEPKNWVSLLNEHLDFSKIIFENDQFIPGIGFICRATYKEKFGEGTGKTKKESKNNAAKDLYCKLSGRAPPVSSSSSSSSSTSSPLPSPHRQNSSLHSTMSSLSLSSSSINQVKSSTIFDVDQINLNPVSYLQEFLDKNKSFSNKPLNYSFSSWQGMHSCEVKIGDDFNGKGQGLQKRIAKKEAAKDCLLKIQNHLNKI